MDNLLEYEKIVYSIINKYSKHFDKDDLYQVGMMGLIEAYNNFDSSFNTKFSTYAYYYVLGEVKKYIRESNSLKVSKDLIKLNDSIVKAKEVMQQRLGREPSVLELSLFLEVDEVKIQEALEACERIKSLDYQEENTDMYNIVSFEEKSLLPEIMDLKEELINLPGLEKKIILARYFSELTQSETSRELGISQVQVSRKESKILKKLKNRLEEVA